MGDAPIELLLTADREARFWGNVERHDDSECWPWRRAVNSSGYGVVRHGQHGESYTTMAHRAAWIYASRKPLGEGQVVDHTCRNRACCNPGHLRAVTVSQNVRATDRYRAGDAEIVRVGPATVRKRGRRYQVLWREYLADGRVRQAGETVATPDAATALAASAGGC